MYDSSPSHPDGEDIFYYLTVYNEPYPQPPAPDVPGLEQGILRGLYQYAPAPSLQTPSSAERPDAPAARAQILASGVAMPWALRARDLLATDWGVPAAVWSATSWTELRRDALACESWNLLHPSQTPRVPYVTSALSGAAEADASGTGASGAGPAAGSGAAGSGPAGSGAAGSGPAGSGPAGPFVAVSDWIRAVPDQIARWVPGPYTSLGTDGFGFSDTRPAARRFFHVDAESIVLAVLAELAKSGAVDRSAPAQAITKYKLDLPVSEALG
jgi:pyruvate dehydrogenase E1 component